MSDHRLEKSVPDAWHFPVAVEDVGEDGQHFALVADADVRANVARVAGLRALPRFEADFDVTRLNGGLHVVGRVSATVGQNCVVSLEPLVNEVAEDIDLIFVPKSNAHVTAAATDKADAAEVKWDEPEALTDGRVDLAALATEFLILGLDPYPRKPGVVFEPPQALAPDGGPFAVLADWSKGRNDR
jgi:hypothetical protein